MTRDTALSDPLTRRNTLALADERSTRSSAPHVNLRSHDSSIVNRVQENVNDVRIPMSGRCPWSLRSTEALDVCDHCLIRSWTLILPDHVAQACGDRSQKGFIPTHTVEVRWHRDLDTDGDGVERKPRNNGAHDGLEAGPIPLKPLQSERLRCVVVRSAGGQRNLGTP